MHMTLNLDEKTQDTKRQRTNELHSYNIKVNGSAKNIQVLVLLFFLASPSRCQTFFLLNSIHISIKTFMHVSH